MPPQVVGARRFERPAFASQTRRSNQAELRPDRFEPPELRNRTDPVPVCATDFTLGYLDCNPAKTPARTSHNRSAPLCPHDSRGRTQHPEVGFAVIHVSRHSLKRESVKAEVTVEFRARVPRDRKRSVDTQARAQCSSRDAKIRRRRDQRAPRCAADTLQR